MRNYPRLQFSIPRDCTLSLYGFCDSDKCNNQAHNGILMNPGWIKHNITTYLIKMIELQYYTRIPYLKGVQVYVRRDPSILYKVDLKAVADVIIKYGVFSFYNDLLPLFPDMFNVLVGRLNINTKPEAIDKVKQLGLRKGYNLKPYPIFRERDERKMINFMLYSKSEKPFQDSYYVAAASQMMPSNQKILYKGLCEKYGSNYQVAIFKCVDT